MVTLKKLASAWFVIAIVFLIPLIVWSSSRNPPLSRTGAAGESTCASCHGGGPGGGRVTIASASGNTYTPGVTQHLSVTISDANAAAWGYEMTAVQATSTSTGAGTFVATDTASSVRANGTKSYAEQANAFPNTTSSHTYAVDWTPPATNVGNVTLYTAGLGADNSGDTSGDSTYTTNLTLTPTGSGNGLSLSASALTFSYQLGGTAPAAQNVSITSTGTALSYTIATSAAWLTATPTSGTTPGSVSVGVNTSGLAAGTYNGTVTVTATGASNSPQTIAVTFNVTSSTPSLTLSPTTLTFSYQTGGTTPASQNVSATSSGSALNYTVTTSAAWLTATPTSGTTPGSISVGVNTSGLATGTYNGTVTVTASGASNSPRTVAVTLNVTSSTPNLTLSPTTLSFGYQVGGTTPAAQTVTTSSSGSALSFTVTTSAAWLTATPASGTTPNSISVGTNTSGLTVGQYTGTVTVTASGAGNSPQRVNVTLTVTVAGPPNLVLSPSSLTFGYLAGGTLPAAQNVNITSSGAGLSYSVRTTGAWLSATPGSGNTPGALSVSVNPSGLAIGTYTGTVTLTASGAANSPVSLSVTLNVTATAPRIRLSPGAFTFNYTAGGTLPAAQNLSVTSGGVALGFTVSTSPSWLSATPTSGTMGGSVSLSVNPSGLAAGSYSGSVTVTVPGASNSPQTVGVTLNVAAQPNLSLSPGSLTFDYHTGAGAPPTQSVSVNSSGGVLSYTTSTSAAWLTASPAGGTTPGTVNVGINPSGLTAGTYNGTVTITSTAAGNSPQKVNVTLTVSAGSASLSLSPSALTFSYQSGGFLPSAKAVSVASNGAALSYTVGASAAGWLSASPTSGTTPGSVSVSVSPSGLGVGTYTGTVTVTASGASNSPQQVSVTLNVTAAVPNLRLSPGAFTFNYTSGGVTPAAQNLTVSSTGSALSYTVAATGSWLKVAPASGTTTGTVSVSVTPTGLAIGTYSGSVTVTSTGAGNSPQTVGVTLIVNAAALNTLLASARALSLQQAPASASVSSLSQSIGVSSSGTPVQFTAEALGGPWLSVTPSGGTTSGEITVTAAPEGLAKGKYAGQVRLSAPGMNSVSVPITFTVASDDSAAKPTASTYLHDPKNTGAVASEWVHGAGVPADDPEDRTNEGLVLMNNATAGSKARAGVKLQNVEGIVLSVLGFDIRQGSLCTLKGPRFVVVTSDAVVHTLGGCGLANAQPAPAKGWQRFRFDLAKAVPAIAPDSTIKSIALVLEDGPDAEGGMVVLDNINVNGNFVGHE